VHDSAFAQAARCAAALLCVLMLSACGRQEEPAEKPRPVSTAVAGDGSAGQTWWVPGQVAARESTPLSFRVDGKILRRAVVLGDMVKAGQVLAELDPQPLRQNLDIAQAQLQAAKEGLDFASRQWARDSKQAKADLISQAQLEQSRNLRAQAQAQYAQARKSHALASDRLTYTRLVSTHEGVITAEQAQTGQNVAAGQAVYTLAWGDGMDVLCDVGQRQVGRLSAGQKAIVWLTAFPDRSYAASVREIAPAADPASRSFRVRLTLAAPAPELRLGMTAAVWFEGETQADGQLSTIPATALFHDDDAPAVWVVRDDGTLALRPVSVVRFDADTVSIGQGLQPGEIVVAKGVHAVSEGQLVKPVLSQGQASAAREAGRAQADGGEQSRAGAHP